MQTMPNAPMCAPIISLLAGWPRDNGSRISLCSRGALAAPRGNILQRCGATQYEWGSSTRTSYAEGCQRTGECVMPRRYEPHDVALYEEVAGDAA